MSGGYPIECEPTENAYKPSEVRLAADLGLNQVGIWQWNLETKEYAWSGDMYRIFNLPPSEFPPRTGTFLHCIHPDDRQKVVRAFGKALVGKQSYNIDHRIVWPDGSVRFIHGEAAVTFDQAGRPIRMLGTVQDLTVRLPAA